jgi:hypothetical protein
MGLFGGSKSANKQATSSATTALEGIYAPVTTPSVKTGKHSNVNISLTDQGAIEAAQKIANAALAQGQNISVSALKYGDTQAAKAFSFADDAGRRAAANQALALKYADAAAQREDTAQANALKQQSNVIGGALRFADTQTAKALTYGDSANQRALAFGRDALNAEQASERLIAQTSLDALKVGADQSQHALDAYGQQIDALVNKTATSADARVEEIGKYALAAVVVLAVLPVIFGSH